MPEVSVVIPTYNRARVIPRAIESACRQTFTDLEILVADDASTDDTERVVCEYSDKRIHYLRCDKNAGAGIARNLGIRHAQGNFIAFLDSDDEWLPLKIEKQVSILKNRSEDWGICLTGAQYIKDGSRIAKKSGIVMPNEGDRGNALRAFVAGRWPYVTPALMIRKSVFDSVGCFASHIRRGEDDEFMLRALARFRVAALREVHVIVHMDRVQPKDPDVMVGDRMAMLRTHEPIVRQYLGWSGVRMLRSRVYYDAASSRARAGQHLRSIGWMFRAFCSYPLFTPRRPAQVFLAIVRALKGPKTSPSRE